MSSFSERTVLVTGGGTGIGKGCAQHFLAGGATVTIAGPDRDMLELAAAELLQATRLAFLYVMASCCWRYGRIEAAVGYTDAGQAVIGRAAMRCRAAFDGVLGAVYLAIAQPERLAELCRAQLARGRNTHTLTRACLVLALRMTGSC